MDIIGIMNSNRILREQVEEAEKQALRDSCEYRIHWNLRTILGSSHIPKGWKVQDDSSYSLVSLEINGTKVWQGTKDEVNVFRSGDWVQVLWNLAERVRSETAYAKEEKEQRQLKAKLQNFDPL